VDLKRNATFYFLALYFIISSGIAQADLSGRKCSECHTVHNSQDGTTVTYRLNTSYTGFESTKIPTAMLLVSSCEGCHTSTGGTTIVSNVPIIFNTSAFSSPLAGGNFSYVRSDDSKGHNIAGITGQDIVHGLTPPGGSVMTSQLECAGSMGCHGDRSAGSGVYSGLNGAHHKDTGVVDGSSVGLSYRFLNGILGREDPDWEQDNVNTSHNEYKGSTSNAVDTISYLCSGCHGNFHTWEGGASEVGTASPWLRHPTDIALPGTGEYGNYTTYSMTSPVARPDPDNVPVTSQVVPGTDIVMCLSCHRTHASPYYKILRWDYKSDTLSTALSGCNVCHTSKN
jgi:hypothetical protein